MMVGFGVVCVSIIVWGGPCCLGCVCGIWSLGRVLWFGVGCWTLCDRLRFSTFSVTRVHSSDVGVVFTLARRSGIYCTLCSHPYIDSTRCIPVTVVSQVGPCQRACVDEFLIVFVSHRGWFVSDESSFVILWVVVLLEEEVIS